MQAASLEARLLGHAALSHVATSGDTPSGSRGLVLLEDVPAGTPVLRLPWSRALTVTSAVARLSALERAGLPLTVLPLAEVLSLCEAPSSLVPSGCGWSVLLSLQLLAELRDGRSHHASFVATLPAPAGSLLACVARGPAAGSHAALFTAAQRSAFCTPALAAELEREAERQSALHALLFGTDSVSRASWVWACALVASRALSLPGLQHVMLPCIDFANHAEGPEATVSVRVVMATDGGPPSGVELVSTRALARGSEVLLDYGPHQLRSWACVYGFVPDGMQLFATELYEEVHVAACGAETLLVELSDGPCGGALRLAEVRMENGSILYVASSGGRAAADAARVVLDGNPVASLLPAVEAHLCTRLAQSCQRSVLVMAEGEAAAGRACEAADVGAACSSAPLAAALRRARRLLLARAGVDLGAHARLLDPNAASMSFLVDGAPVLSAGLTLVSVGTLATSAADAGLDLFSSASGGKASVKLLALSQATVAGLQLANGALSGQQHRGVSLVMATSHAATAVFAQLDKGKRGGLKEEEANILSGVAAVSCALSLAHALLPRKAAAVKAPPLTGRQLSAFEAAKKKAASSRR